MLEQPKKWLVGLDLGPRSDGAIRFAAWLARNSGDTLVGAHVMEEAIVHIALRYHHLAELEAKATSAAEALVAHAKASDVLGSVVISRGRTAEDQLDVARAELGCDGIIIGRNAPREGHHAFRLGRVARRLLRTLSSPIIVVPPDWSEQSLGAGPILAACSLDDDSRMACEMARGFSQRLHRDLELVHVAAMPDHHSAQYLSDLTLAAIRHEHLTGGELELDRWAQEHGFSEAKRSVVLGTVSERLAAVAQERNALAIAVGSRRLSTLERWLLASSGSSLAAHADCPVLVAAG